MEIGMEKDRDDAMGSEPSEETFVRWEETRKKGPVHYVIASGCLGWGLLSGVAFSIVFSLAMPSGRVWRTCFVPT
jgi:hypothetical protein